MADIDVQATGKDTYRVTVTEGRSSTTHDVTLDPAADPDRGATPEQLIEASFRFLLEREPKEAILGRFDLSVIARYFPEYPALIGKYL